MLDMFDLFDLFLQAFLIRFSQCANGYVRGECCASARLLSEEQLGGLAMRCPEMGYTWPIQLYTFHLIAIKSTWSIPRDMQGSILGKIMIIMGFSFSNDLVVFQWCRWHFQTMKVAILGRSGCFEALRREDKVWRSLGDWGALHRHLGQGQSTTKSFKGYVNCNGFYGS